MTFVSTSVLLCSCESSVTIWIPLKADTVSYYLRVLRMQLSTCTRVAQGMRLCGRAQCLHMAKQSHFQKEVWVGGTTCEGVYPTHFTSALTFVSPATPATSSISGCRCSYHNECHTQRSCKCMTEEDRRWEVDSGLGVGCPPGTRLWESTTEDDGVVQRPAYSCQT